MSKLVGNQGSVTATSTTSNWGAGVVVGSVYQWDFTYDADIKDVTAFGSSGYKEYTNGNNSGTGSLRMYADSTTALNLKGSTNPTLTLLLNGSGRQVSGTAVISNFKITVDGKDSNPSEVSFDFSMTGSFTVA